MSVQNVGELPPVAQPKRQVLIVEDNSWVALTIAEEVTELGCVVVGPARTLSEGLALARSEILDGALVDITLGGGEDAYPVAHVLSERRVPFVFITGKTETPDVPFEKVPVLRKPFGSAGLRRSVTQILAKL